MVYTSRPMRTTFFYVLLLLLYVPRLYAESGTLRGTVQDVHGNAVSNASITLTNSSSDDPKRRVVTTEDGRFSIQAPIGAYSIEIQASSFEVLEERVRIQPGVD